MRRHARAPADDAANDNAGANPTIVALPPPGRERVELVLDTLADVLVKRAFVELGLEAAND